MLVPQQVTTTSPMSHSWLLPPDVTVCNANGTEYVAAAAGTAAAATHLLSKVKAGVVGYKGPADNGAQEGKGPGDPELVAVAQVVEPDYHQDGAHLASGGRNAVGCTSDGSRVHLQQQ